MGRVVKIGARLRSRVISALISERFAGLRRRGAEIRRRALRRPHVVHVFLGLDDPYSYLLSSYLRELREYYAVELVLHVTDALGGGFRPAPELAAEYALDDARRLAAELGVPFLDRGNAPPVEQRRVLLSELAATQASPGFDDDVIDCLAAYWRGDTESAARRASSSRDSRRHDSTAAADMLQQNATRLRSMGHYNTAMLYYGGEWYWGVDRLHYLVDRLDELGAARAPGLAPRIASIRQVMQLALPARPPAAARKLPPVELFHSFRSPYSYLLLERLFTIVDAFGVELRIRPVLPMVMRGLPVPREKLMYIVRDAAREARRRGIAFGRIADPVGQPTERCMAVFEYARSQRRERAFVLEAGRALWAERIDVGTDEGMRKLTARVGLFWPDVVQALADDAWRANAERRRASMTESGLWGVPTVRVGDWQSWGQDRDWLLARHLEELCDSGEGILI